MAEERTQRWTEAQRAEQRANARKATAGAKYGTSFYEQGYRPEKDQGLHFLRLQQMKQEYGAHVPWTWDFQVRNGEFYVKPMATDVDGSPPV